MCHCHLVRTRMRPCTRLPVISCFMLFRVKSVCVAGVAISTHTPAAGIRNPASSPNTHTHTLMHCAHARYTRCLVYDSGKLLFCFIFFLFLPFFSFSLLSNTEQGMARHGKARRVKVTPISLPVGGALCQVVASWIAVN